jgi:hypothetical protein
MVGILSLCFFAMNPQIKVDPKYMLQAFYPAGSMKHDTVSPGGNAESSNMPHLLVGVQKVKALYANLSAVDGGVRIDLRNSSGQDEWMRAADGNMLAWLEALDGKDWKPIEYHHWVDCGNSFHRVVLPPGYEWTYLKVLPKGDLKTLVRWVAVKEKLKVTSNMISIYIPRTRTSIPPGIAGQFDITNNSFPILMPKR